MSVVVDTPRLKLKGITETRPTAVWRLVQTNYSLSSPPTFTLLQQLSLKRDAT